MEEVAVAIDEVLAAIGTPELDAVVAAVKARVLALTARHPLPY
jgi:hypothetical protein